MLNTIYILLGANLKSPITQLESAQTLLNEKLGKIKASSSIYESEAWGIEDQPIFYNQVLMMETSFSAVDSLLICQEIENDLGRTREKKWGARLIDIDILYYNNEIIETESLKVPHPYLHLRNFTLVPLVEIAADYIHPLYQLTNKQLMINSKDNLKVIKT